MTPESSAHAHLSGPTAAGATPGAANDVQLTDSDGELLLDAAIHALEEHLSTSLRSDQLPEPAAVAAPPLSRSTARLEQPGASFVTLRNHRGDLLGCIGTIEPYRPLLHDVEQNARAAASRDPRFAAVRTEDLRGGDVHLSVLSEPEPLAVGDARELAAALRPGRDGLLIEAGNHRATFLPAVWHQLPDVQQFLDHLWDKAGLPRDSWPPDLSVWCYRSHDFSRRIDP